MKMNNQEVLMMKLAQQFCEAIGDNMPYSGNMKFEDILMNVGMYDDKILDSMMGFDMKDDYSRNLFTRYFNNLMTKKKHLQ